MIFMKRMVMGPDTVNTSTNRLVKGREMSVVQSEIQLHGEDKKDF
jgi:hypothetical protein